MPVPTSATINSPTINLLLMENEMILLIMDNSVNSVKKMMVYAIESETYRNESFIIGQSYPNCRMKTELCPWGLEKRFQISGSEEE